MEYPKEFTIAAMIQALSTVPLLAIGIYLIASYGNSGDKYFNLTFFLVFIIISMWFFAGSLSWFRKSRYSYIFLITSSALWIALKLYLVSDYLYGDHPLRFFSTVGYHPAILILDILVINFIYQVSIMMLSSVREWASQQGSLIKVRFNPAILAAFLITNTVSVLLISFYELGRYSLSFLL